MGPVRAVGLRFLVLGSVPKRRVIAIFRTAPGAPGEILSQANGRSPVFSAGMNDLRLVHQLADNVQPPPAGALREHTRDRRLVYDGRSIIVDEDPKLRAIAGNLQLKRTHAALVGMVIGIRQDLSYGHFDALDDLL